jgi:hypothetical protein
MHSEERSQAPRQGVSQAEADQCCAASQQDESAPTPVLTLTVPTGTVTLLSAITQDAAWRAERWRTSAPLPTPHIPKHLLLSVLLV